MSGAYDDHDDDALAQEGVQAFNRMTAAMDRLGDTLTAVDYRQKARLADEAVEASIARLAAQDAKDAANLALQAAKASARSVAAWAVLGALAGVLVASGAGYWIGQSSGWKAGQAAGYATAVDEKAAAAWANTPSGRLAFALDQNGSLAMLATCNNKGWQIEKRQGQRICFPDTVPDGSPHGTVYGWTLP